MTPQLVSVQNREGHSPVRVYRYECGHERQTVLLVPPEECVTCRGERYTRETEEQKAHWLRILNRRTAIEQANSAHDYGKRHMICDYCIESIKADMYAFGERMADMFSPEPVRGFQA